MPKNNGKKFEKNFQESCKKSNVLFERFIDSNKFGNNNASRFTPQNPCDGFMFSGNLIYVELKSTTTGSLSYNVPPNLKVKGKQFAIKPHQVQALMERSEYDGVYCGLIIDFSDRQTKTKFIQGGTYYIDINDFFIYALESGKGSINLEDAKKIGIEIPRKKKVTNYTYDIQSLIKRIC